MLTLRNATIVDTDGHRTGNVVIEDGQITAVGDSADGKTVDLSGRYLAPGLIDTHVHLMMDARPAGTAEYTSREPRSKLAYRAVDNLQRAASVGVTTVRDLGSQASIAIEAGEAVEKGWIDGPRVRACGEPIVVTGGHANHMGYEADGVAEVKKATRKQLKRGASVIKCMSSGNMLVEGQRGPPELDRSELEAIVDVAHKKNVPVAAHAHGAESIKNAVQAGVDSIEHGTYMDRQTAQLLAAEDVYWVPTRNAIRAYARGNDRDVPSTAVELAKEAESAIEEAFRYAVNADVPVAMGTDAGTALNPFSTIPREMALLTEGGLTPEEALRAATTNAADLLGYDEVGRIKPGYRADLVVLPRDPLEDVTAWQDIERTYVAGALFEPHDEPSL
jgi:imidazolonepropionase-like amidohydrolase